MSFLSIKYKVRLKTDIVELCGLCLQLIQQQIFYYKTKINLICSPLEKSRARTGLGTPC